MDLQVVSISSERGIQDLVPFIHKQEQSYPNFNNWVEHKLEPRLLSGRYSAIVGIEASSISGCIVYEKKEDCIDVKNFRIDPSYRHRLLGQFLMEQIGTYKLPILTDITVTNFSAVKFFIRNGFEIQEIANLYSPEQLEYIIRKEVS